MAPRSPWAQRSMVAVEPALEGARRADAAEAVAVVDNRWGVRAALVGSVSDQQPDRATVPEALLLEALAAAEVAAAAKASVAVEAVEVAVDAAVEPAEAVAKEAQVAAGVAVDNEREVRAHALVVGCASGSTAKPCVEATLASGVRFDVQPQGCWSCTPRSWQVPNATAHLPPCSQTKRSLSAQAAGEASAHLH